MVVLAKKRPLELGMALGKVNSKLEKGLKLVVFQNKVKLKHVYSNIRWLLWGIVLGFTFDFFSVVAHIHSHN